MSPYGWALASLYIYTMASNELQLLEQIDQNFLLCIICSGRYKNAKCLPCLHNFCESCLTKVVKGSDSSITCPTCRRTYRLTNGGVSGITTNFFIDHLVEMFTKRDHASGESAKCAGCRRGECTTYCIECGVELCDNCVVAHRNLPTTRTHRVVTLDEYNTAKSHDPVSVQPPLYCSRHPEYQVEFYCDTCDVTICLKCTALDHPMTTHKYRCVNDAASDYSKTLSNTIEEVKVKIIEANDSKLAVEGVSESLDKRFQTEIKKVNEHVQNTVEEVTRMIQESSAHLLTDLNDEYNSRKKNLNAQLKELEGTEDDLFSANDYAEKLMQYGNAAQLMSAKKGMVDRMEELLKMETKTSPSASAYMEFLACGDFCKEKTAGIVITSEATYKLTDIPKFVRVGENVAVTVAMEPSHASQRNNKLRTMEVETSMKTPDNKNPWVEVNGNKDGTVTVKTQPDEDGEHELSVWVRKKHVEGSPAIINVIPRRGSLSKFGLPGQGIAQLDNPWGVAMTQNRDVLVCDYNNRRLQSFSTGGKSTGEFKFTNCGCPVNPFDVDVSDNGNVFITDSGNKQIIVCDENGKVIRCFGKGKLQWPIGIAINPTNSRVYVVDQSASCIQIYSQVGYHIKSFGSQGNMDGELSHPRFLCIDDDGNVYVSDNYNHRIQVFDADGHFRYSFGSEGSGDGQMKHPCGVCLDKAGYVYISDYGNNRVVKFESGGEYVGRVDNDQDGLRYPRGICVQDDEPFSKVIVTDGSDNSIKIFAQ
ncbi:E3 ubiquitin-protein ligase TRIM45-like [Glandiceps talaboti]